MLLVGSIFFGVGALLSLPFCWGIPVDIAIAISHDDLPATVQSSRLNRNVRVNGIHPTKITFTYQVDGEQYEGEGDTRKYKIIKVARPGSTVPVEVSTSHPSWARLQGETYSWTGYFGLIVLLFPGIGATILFFTIRAHRRAVRAFRFGIPVLAEVAARGKVHNVKINGQHPFHVRWKFQVNGRFYYGSLTSMSSLEIEDLMSQDRLPVLYDPDNPGVNCVYLV